MKNLTAKDVMNTRIVSVSATWKIDKLAQFFIDQSISGAPVKDKNGKLVGVVSVTDIVRAKSELSIDSPDDYYLYSWENRLTKDDLTSFHLGERNLMVQDIMTPLLFHVDEDASIQEVADFMVKNRIHRVFVTRDERIAGIVTTIDMLKVIRDM